MTAVVILSYPPFLNEKHEPLLNGMEFTRAAWSFQVEEIKHAATNYSQIAKLIENTFGDKNIVK